MKKRTKYILGAVALVVVGYLAWKKWGPAGAVVPVQTKLAESTQVPYDLQRLKPYTIAATFPRMP